MNDLNAIRARLGAISPTALAKLPKAVQTLLKEDLPLLIRAVDIFEALLKDVGHSMYRNQKRQGIPTVLLILMPDIKKWLRVGECLTNEGIAESTIEQQIKDMPW